MFQVQKLPRGWEGHSPLEDTPTLSPVSECTGLWSLQAFLISLSGEAGSLIFSLMLLCPVFSAPFTDSENTGSTSLFGHLFCFHTTVGHSSSQSATKVPFPLCEKQGPHVTWDRGAILEIRWWAWKEVSGSNVGTCRFYS